MKFNNTEIRDQILSTRCGRKMLKQMIKAKRRQKKKILERRKRFLEDEALYPNLGEIRQYFLELIFDQLREGQFIPDIERDLRNMSWAYESTHPEFEKRRNYDWERKYEHATRQVLVEEVIWSLLGHRNGKVMVTCPFHEDKTPSLKIYPNSRSWNCFGCEARGSPIDFVMQFSHLDFKEAVEFLWKY